MHVESRCRSTLSPQARSVGIVRAIWMQQATSPGWPEGWQYLSISVFLYVGVAEYLGINTSVFQYCSIATSVFQYFIKLSIAVFRHF
jgi:hypothetical protein